MGERTDHESENGLSRRRLLEGIGVTAALGIAGCSGTSGGNSPTDTSVETTSTPQTTPTPRETTTRTTTETPTQTTTTYAPDADPDGDGLTKEVEEKYILPVEGDGEYGSFASVVDHLDEEGWSDTGELVEYTWHDGEGLDEYEKAGFDAFQEFDEAYWDTIAGHIVGNEGLGQEDSLYLQTVAELQDSEYVDPGQGLNNEFVSRFLGRDDRRGLEKVGDMYLPTVEYLGLDTEDPDDRIEKIRNQLFEGQGLNPERMEYLNRVSDSIDECHSPVNQLKELGKLYKFSEDGEITDEELRMVANEDGDQLIRIKEERAGTDPLSADKDKDGLEDGYEVYLLTNSSIDKKDVFIEVDYEKGIQREEIEQELHEVARYLEQNVPTGNGHQGIDIHWKIDQAFPELPEDISIREAHQLMRQRSDRLGEGYFWMGLLDGDTTVDNRTGNAALDIRRQQGAVSMEYRSIILHELTHLLGIGSGTFEHVDSTEVSFEKSLQ